MTAEAGISGLPVRVRLSSTDEKWRKKKEKWMVLMGIVLHAVYMMSIFDIYFKSPIVHGIDPVTPRITPPAERVVLFIADGLRADKFFELETAKKSRAPFLRSIIYEKGRWGVSHARPPTESRPGHVAIIAGFYEDPSAVTKGWKANPVEFDSVFNRSRHTFAFGSPDILPIFCGGLNHCSWSSYPHEYEDFATDASFLDEWSFDHFRGLLNKSNEDHALKQLLHQDKLVIFLHLLGCDTNGHAHRPYSLIYLNNVKVVDKGIEETYNLIEEYFNDNRTAYIFTADHGMSDKGSHGDGHPTNTDTPLVAWGAGIQKPKLATSESSTDIGFRFVDEHTHDMPTPPAWDLESIERVDVNQADIAPLMTTLLGLASPLNSVGSLPMEYLNLDKEEQAEAAFANVKQILNQFLRKSQLKQSRSLHFRPFGPLSKHHIFVKEIEKLISSRQYEAALHSAQDLITLCLAGLHYFQTYDWFSLMTTITMGYLGWMVYIILHVLKCYTCFLATPYETRLKAGANEVRNKRVRIFGGLLMVLFSIILLIERSPPLYHIYLALAIFLWTEIFSDSSFIQALWRALQDSRLISIAKLMATCIVSFLILELLVSSFFERRVYSGVFLIAGIVGAVFVSCNTPGLSMVPAFVWASCWFLSCFTLMPAEIPDHTQLVVGSGIILVLVAIFVRSFDCILPKQDAWHPIVSGLKHKRDVSWKLFILQVFLVILSSGMVWISTTYRAQRRQLLLFHQLINWSLAGFSMVLPLFSSHRLLDRLSSIFLGFGPAFLLLSIGYEALFYSALATVLVSWILVECAILYLPFSETQGVGLADQNTFNKEDSRQRNNRFLKLSDVRIALCFLILINVAFFGTGNVASIASFEISSVYRFITIFNPFIMAALLLFKLFIPFILVTCAFSAVTNLVKLPRLGCYFMVLLFSDVMTIHFFFLVSRWRLQARKIYKSEDSPQGRSSKDKDDQARTRMTFFDPA
ncbi:uncharacterized protein LOC131030393 isoform X2 [Cryptomeria japonica]|uniref:uncharacterized protein LOC131030393 isoform X2 n=1 Tax=Cryptomeria japonica TaxID=3369 RepID=UPI0027DA90A8|nr:uncharacterized protein LOC131030393 isoform X2 [Cryptomeria japonica]